MAMLVVYAVAAYKGGLTGSQPKSGGLVWGSAAAWRCTTLIRWTE